MDGAAEGVGFGMRRAEAGGEVASPYSAWVVEWLSGHLPCGGLEPDGAIRALGSDICLSVLASLAAYSVAAIACWIFLSSVSFFLASLAAWCCGCLRLLGAQLRPVVLATIYNGRLKGDVALPIILP